MLIKQTTKVNIIYFCLEICYTILIVRLSNILDFKLYYWFLSLFIGLGILWYLWEKTLNYYENRKYQMTNCECALIQMHFDKFGNFEQLYDLGYSSGGIVVGINSLDTSKNFDFSIVDRMSLEDINE